MGDSVGIALSLLALLPPAARAQHLPPVIYPPLPAEAATARGFVPKGWRIEARAGGDLDGDGRADLALVLRSRNPANVIPEAMCETRFDTIDEVGDGLMFDPDNLVSNQP
jgi:hypothetical protein